MSQAHQPGVVAAVITGASGAGKTTVGQALATTLGWSFVDADDLHTAGSIEKMRQGIGLSDDERWPWLGRVRDAIDAHLAAGRSVVVACSALREPYRAYLADGRPSVRFVFLRAPASLLEHRLARRTGHFAAVGLLTSQLQTLEPPADALEVDAALAVDVLVDRIGRWLRSNG